MTDQLLDIFRTEAQELLADLEGALLKMENNPHDKDGVATIFRAMHTLKGSAGMFGYDAVNGITHHLENIYQDIRDGKQVMSPEVLGITFKTFDHLRELMDDPQMQNTDLLSRHQVLLDEIKQLHKQPTPDATNGIEQPSRAGKVRTYYIYVLPNADILRNGNNTLYLIEDLLALGQGIALPFFKDLPSLETIQESNSYLGFEVVLTTEKSESDIREVFMFVEDDCELVVKEIAETDLLKSQQAASNLWKGHDASGPKGFDAIRSLLYPHPRSRKENTQNEQQKSGAATSIRVGSERLDELMNLVSELVTTQARLSLFCNEHNEGQQAAELTNIAENVEKITRRLRDNAFNMSLVPLESLVVRFQRLVRDLSLELNKDIQFKTEGTDTELDKSIIEKLTDPLLHLLRNSIDHGIEIPEQRLRHGKLAKGTLLLKAYYSGANVVIEITDDGAGINLDRVREKAISNGIITSDAQLNEKELLDLIFLPGFSTAAKVTGISGRGVGMDVVRRNINDIRGEIEVKTRAAQGTTFTITLPLTLSILDGMLVKIGNTDFILPLGSVAKCYEVETEKLESTFNHWTTLDGERTPFFFLRRDFGITDSRPHLSQVINVAFNGSFIGLAVDKVEGEYQAVLKPLGRLYEQQDEFSGATILGNGTVALVIDPNKLIRKLTQQHKSINI